MAYTQTFRTLAGTELTIFVPEVTVSPTAALLAESPIETEEDADADMFKPVRRQSGYLHLQSMDAASWRAFIPYGATDQPVMLTHGSTVVWQGYLQTGTYGMAFPATYETVDLPLCCPLTALDSFDVDSDGPAKIVTIGQLLNYIFSKLTGLSLTFYFQVGTLGSVQTWLNYSVIWRNFFNGSGDGQKARFSCLGLLEEICKLFGWTCRTMGDGVYFTSITDDQRNDHFIYCSLSALADKSRSWSTLPMSSLALSAGHYATDEHDEEYLPGVGHVSVNSELNPYEVLIDLPYEEMYREHKYDTPTAGPDIKRWRVFYDNEIWLLYRNATGQETFENLDVAVSAYVESATEGQPQCYGRFIVFDNDVTFDGSTPVPKAKHSWIKAFECFRSGDYGSRTSQTPLFSLTSKQAYTIGGGVLWINGRCDIDVDLGDDAIYHATCTLKIGNRYWNGSAWTTTAGTFELEYVKDGIRDVQASGYPMAAYEGLGIPVTAPLSGSIYFAVNDVQPIITSLVPGVNGYFPLMDFQIGFVRGDEDSELNDISYTADGGTFPDNIDVDTIFSTDKTRVAGSRTIRCQMGYGLLLSGDNVVQTVPYGSISNMKPEQRTADLIAAYGSTVRRSLSLDLWTDTHAASGLAGIGQAVGPAYRLTVDDSKQYYPVSVSHQWADNITRLKLMEI